MRTEEEEEKKMAAAVEHAMNADFHEGMEEDAMRHLAPLPLNILEVRKRSYTHIYIHRFVFTFGTTVAVVGSVMGPLLVCACGERLTWCVCVQLTMAYILLEHIQNDGINSGDLKKLNDGGIFTVEQLAHSNRRDLVAIKGLSDAKVEKLISAGTCIFAL